VAALLPTVALGAECTDTWTGPAEGSWEVASNWSAKHVPTGTDVACIGTGKTVNLYTGAEVSIVQGEGAVVVEVGLLKLLNTSEASVLSTLTLADWSILTGPGTLEISEHLTWSGLGHEAVMSGSGTTVIQSGATVTASPKYNANLTERTFVNEGTFALTSGDLYEASGAEFVNEGTFTTETGSEHVIAAPGTASFVNLGSFKKVGGTGPGLINASFKNEGLVEAQTGSLLFAGGGSSTPAASWEAAEEAELNFYGNHPYFFTEGTISGPIVINSVVNLDGTNLEAADVDVEVATLGISGNVTIPSLTLADWSVLTGPGTLEISEHLTWSGLGHEAVMSGSGTTVIQPGATVTAAPKYNANLTERTFVNEGTFSLTSGDLYEASGAEFINEGTFTTETSNEHVIAGPGTAKFVNVGSFKKVGGTGPGLINASFKNEGLLEAHTGSLIFTGGGSATPTSTWDAAEEAELTFSSGFFFFTEGTISGPIVVNTVVNIEGSNLEAAEVEVEVGTLSIGGDVTISSLSLAEWSVLSGPGSLEISEHLTWGGGEREAIMSGPGKTVIQPGATVTAAPKYNANLTERTFVNEGTFTLTSGDLYEASGAEFVNDGTFTTTTSSEHAIGGSAAAKFVNAGSLEKTAGLEITAVLPAFENLGTIKETSGHFKIEHPVSRPASNKFRMSSCGGDPVDCATGNFSESQADIAIGGLGVGLELIRTYSAQAAATAGSPGAFGYGWTASFSDHLVSAEEGKTVTLFSADGGTVPFASTGGGSFKAPVWSQDKLSGSAEAGYTLIFPSQVEERFSGAGKLESVSDRNGNETTLAYEGSGHLETITDPAGRQITLAYNGSGRVESAEDPMGHLVTYGYESNQLTSVTMPGQAEPRWSFKYDGSHRITQVTDGRGGKTKNEYDGSSRVFSQTDPVGHTTTFEYAPFHTKVTNVATGSVADEWFTSNNEPYSITHGFGTADATTETFSYNAAGLLLSRTDGNGHKTSYGYNAAGDRTSEKDANGNTTKWSFNETHDVISFTTPGNETATIERDPNGNVESISRPAPEATTQTSTFVYDGEGQLESVTDPLERTWAYGYDAAGNRTSETDPIGNTATLEYDEDSRLIAIVSPRGNAEGAEALEYTTKIGRDPQGRPEEFIDPLEHSTKYAYDADGNLEAQIDANGHTTKYVYNKDNQRTKVEKPNGAILETAYDAAGNVISQTDANEETITYVRNALGEPVEVIDPLNRKTIEEFDPAGNLETLIDPEARQATYGYDPAGRLTEVDYSEGATPDVQLEYNPDGNVMTMIDGTGESRYEYDQLGRLTESEDGHGDVIGYEYDLAEESIGLTYPNGESISREFDEAGRLERVTDWLGHTTTFSYDPDSNLEAIAFPGGSGNVDEYAYDQADHMGEAKFAKGALASLSYARGKVGEVEEEVRKGLPGPEKTLFGYDKNNRLTSAGATNYEYDPADNLIEAPGTTNKYDSASQLETGTGRSYVYDELGERTKTTPISGPATFYEYDQAGNLISIQRSAEGAVSASWPQRRAG